MKFLAFVILFVSFQSYAVDSNSIQLGPIEPSIAMDFVLPVQFDGSEDNRLTVRSIELMFNAELATHLKGHFNFALHDEHGNMESDVHEAYLETTQLHSQLKLKFGKFLLGVGRLNTLHQHDWLFTTTPKVQQDFFAAEGVTDTGVQAIYTLPTESGWDVIAGVTDGYQYGHSHDEGARPKSPTAYLHLINYVDVGDDGLFQWGLNYLHRNDHEDNEFQLMGLDFHWQDTRSKAPQYIVSSEVWYRKMSQGPHDEDHPHDHSDPDHSHAVENLNSHYNDGDQLGLYIYSEYKLKDAHAIGLRVDYFQYFKAHNHDAVAVDVSEYTISPAYIYTLNDQSKLRLSYGYTHQQNNDTGNESQQNLTLQWVALLGGHNHAH